VPSTIVLAPSGQGRRRQPGLRPQPPARRAHSARVKAVDDRQCRMRRSPRPLLTSSQLTARLARGDRGSLTRIRQRSCAAASRRAGVAAALRLARRPHPDAVYSLDPAGRFVSVNAACDDTRATTSDEAARHIVAGSDRGGRCGACPGALLKALGGEAQDYEVTIVPQIWPARRAAGDETSRSSSTASASASTAWPRHHPAAASARPDAAN